MPPMPTLLTNNGDRDESTRRRGRRFAAPDSTGAPDGPGATTLRSPSRKGPSG